MVAYSFNRRFVPAIEAGLKRQTIRSHRRRHARVGEALQLYTGMRTKACRLIRDDVVCVRLDEVRFDLRALDGLPVPKNSRQLQDLVAASVLPIEVNGMPLEGELRERFAAEDGFAGWTVEDVAVPAFAAMVMFWMAQSGARLFEGVAIHWEPAS
jgi:hypothetical protein